MRSLRIDLTFGRMAKISYIRPSRFFLSRLYPDFDSAILRLTLISSERVGVTFWAAIGEVADKGVGHKRWPQSGEPGAAPRALCPWGFLGVGSGPRRNPFAAQPDGHVHAELPTGPHRDAGGRRVPRHAGLR